MTADFSFIFLLTIKFFIRFLYRIILQIKNFESIDTIVFLYYNCLVECGVMFPDFARYHF